MTLDESLALALHDGRAEHRLPDGSLVYLASASNRPELIRMSRDSRVDSRFTPITPGEMIPRAADGLPFRIVFTTGRTVWAYSCLTRDGYSRSGNLVGNGSFEDALAWLDADRPFRPSIIGRAEIARASYDALAALYAAPPPPWRRSRAYRTRPRNAATRT